MGEGSQEPLQQDCHGYVIAATDLMLIGMLHGSKVSWSLTPLLESQGGRQGGGVEAHLYVMSSYSRQPNAQRSLVKVYFLFCHSSGGM